MIKGRLSKARELTLGADPEMFLFSKGKLLPAFQFLPSKNDGQHMYWDGFQAEWKYDYEDNYCLNNLVLHTREKLMTLAGVAKRYDPDAKLSLTNVVRVPKATLDTVHPQYVELGCQPSYNAYGLKGEPVYDPRQLKYRFAGGHMHFGTWLDKRPDYKKIVKTLDSILGVWSVGVARNLDNPIRRKYYGLPGEYRMPVYNRGERNEGFGVEYRVLSNFWLASPAVLQLTWDIGRQCVRLASSKHLKLWAGNQDETIDIIKNSDVKGAAAVIKRNEPMFRWLLKGVYGTEKAVERALLLSYHGLEEIAVPNPHDFATNWHYKALWVPDGKAPWARWEPYGS